VNRRALSVSGSRLFVTVQLASGCKTLPSTMRSDVETHAFEGGSPSSGSVAGNGALGSGRWPSVTTLPCPDRAARALRFKGAV